MVDYIRELRELTARLPSMWHYQPEMTVRVLIVEEQKSVNRLIVDTLSYFVCDWKAAENIKDALEKIEKYDFDILLANVVLKREGEGAIVVKAFQDKSPNSVVIIMSSDEDRLKDYSKFFATLVMPFGMYDLVKRVQGGMENKR